MRSIRTLAAAALFALPLPLASAVAQRQQASPREPAITYAAATKLEYKQAAPGVSTAVAWGDPDKGAHSAFTRFAPGFDAGVHTHTNEVTIVVLKGAYLYRDESGEKRVGPGDFLRIPAGHKHWSGGDATEGAEFYQHSTKKFDQVSAK